MGLDIVAYSNLKKAYVAGIDEDTLYDCYVRVFDVGFGRLDGMEEGWYKKSPESTEQHFRAGSYSGYSYWRSQLADFAYGVAAETVWKHPDDYQGRAFYELINFSDCEGCIGPKTSAKLAKDFEDNLFKATEFANDRTVFPDKEDGDYWIDRYRQWLSAFRVASQDGVVRFC